MITKTFQDTEVPVVGFGTYPLRGDACMEAVGDALSLGYRHVDTAQAYANEEAVGRALSRADIPRDEIFLTTKVSVDNIQARRTRVSTEESLHRLGTDYVDLLLIHWPVEEVEPEETLDEMMHLQEEGKVRHIGVSNFPRGLMKQVVAHAPIFCNQVEFHPFLEQDSLLELCAENDIMVTAYSPLAKGQVARNDLLQDIGNRYHKSPPQVALRWLIQHDPVTVIPKAGSREHRRANLDIFDFELTGEEMEEVATLRERRRLTDPSWGPVWEQV
ncbi:MAG: aldo/keto reductase [Bacteroidota bacterium]